MSKIHKANNSANPNLQKIIIRQSQNTSTTKDLLDFYFLDENENKVTVGQLFDTILDLKEEVTRLKEALSKYQSIEDKADTALANSVEELSKQILLITTQMNERMSALETKTQYM